VLTLTKLAHGLLIRSTLNFEDCYVHPIISKKPDFEHFISLDGMNSFHSFNKYKNTKDISFLFFWLLAAV